MNPINSTENGKCNRRQRRVSLSQRTTIVKRQHT